MKYVTRLYHVKGKRNVRITPVDVSIKSLNQGDVFVLDTHNSIMVWTGPTSSIGERRKVRFVE
jgi:hypothetical protein